MNRGNRAFTWLVLTAFLAAAAFAVDRYLTMRAASEESAGAIADLQLASELLNRPRVSSKQGQSMEGTARLKRLIRECGSRDGIQPGFISDSEGDAGKGFRERIITFRYSEVPHASLVKLLSTVERDGDGATFKEIRLTPSDRQPGRYKNAECVLTWRCLDEKNERVNK